MSEILVASVRDAYEAWNQGDWDVASAALHPEFEWTTAPQVPNAGVYRGREAVKAFFKDQGAAFDHWAVEPEEFLEGDDRVVAFIKIRAVPKGSSKEIEIRIAHLWTFRGGKAIAGQAFPRREEALVAAGLGHDDA